MPPPQDREPRTLIDLMGLSSDFTRSDLYRLTRQMALRMADPDTPEAEMRLIRLAVKALTEIAERWERSLEDPPTG